MNTSCRAVLFDLDGTLLNTLDDLAAAVNAALEAFSLPRRSVEEVRLMVGNGVRLLVRRALGLEPTPGLDTVVEAHPEVEFDRVFAWFQTYYAEHSMDRTSPYEGVPELLDALRARGIKIGVVSNKMQAAVPPLCRHYFGGCIDVAVGENEAGGIRKKPAPDMVMQALTLLSKGQERPLTPDEVVYVGDSDVDIATACNAGTRSVSVTWGFRSEEFLREAGADHLAHTAEELEAVLFECF